MLGVILEWLLALILLVAGAQATPEPAETATAIVPTPEPTATVAAPDAVSVICAPQYTWNCSTALAVVACESGFDQWATGALGETGWWQLHPIHGLGAAGYDPYISTEYAHQLYLLRGWQPWACARGAY